jgi:cytochrome P450
MAFDVDRPRVPGHVAFGGGGVHFCLGASLARIELAELVAEVQRRDLRLSVVGKPEMVSSNFVNGINRINVELVGA